MHLLEAFLDFSVAGTRVGKCLSVNLEVFAADIGVGLFTCPYLK